MNTIVDRSLLNGAIPFGECGFLASDGVDVNEDVVRTASVSRFNQHETIFFEGDQAETERESPRADERHAAAAPVR